MSSELIFYKPKIRNFGDYLNELLVESLNLKSLPCPTLGIGSILTNSFLINESLSHSEIFTLGSGCRSNDSIDHLSFIEGSFVRGPLSAKAFGGKVGFVSDGAYLFRQTALFDQLKSLDKKYEVSLVPYFRSYEFYNWSELEKMTGIHIINPTFPDGLTCTIREIAQSKLIISEAMHGAIVSDIFRVPWVQLDFLASSFERKIVNQFKWSDWQKSIGWENCRPIETDTYHKLAALTKNYRLKNEILRLTKKQSGKKLEVAIQSFLREPYHYLSEDHVLQSIDDQLAKALNQLKDA